MALLIPVVKLSAQVSAGFTIQAPVSNCNPAVYGFTNTSSGTPPLIYEWNFGVYPGVNSIFQNPSTTYLGCGTFPVKLVVTNGNGQKDSSIQTVTVRCSPQASLNASVLSGCVPFATTFTSTSLAGSGSIATYLWDFGDGHSSSGANPIHTYTDAGCKNITLIVTNTYNCSNSLTAPNVLCAYASPVANFTANNTTSCTTPFTIAYNNISDSGLAPYSFRWDFAGGIPATSTAPAPSVTYNATGNFSTTLIVTDANGCSDSLRKNGFVNIPQDTADFTLSAVQGCTPANINANGISSTAPLSWHWTISPVATITNGSAQNTSFIFPDTGTYNICLGIDYGGGCTAQKCSTVVIHPSPVAGYHIAGILNTCIQPAPVTFTDSSTGQTLSYLWSFPGGVPSSSSAAQPPVINYGYCGNYSASLKVTDGNGCTASYSTPGFLRITCPVASFTVAPSLGCSPLTATFNSSSSTGNPVAWAWNFGDTGSGSSNTSSLQNPSHTYNFPGCYDVSLTTTNAQGCTATVTLHDAVCDGHKPHANFSGNPPVNCANMPFFFTDSSTNTYSYTTYVWDFHGGPPYHAESTLQNPSFIFSDTGYASIALIVSNYGCADTITKDNLIYLKGPVAIVTYARSCGNPLQLNLDGTRSIDAQRYQWVIPGATPAAAYTPTVTATYDSAGTYTATLIATNDSTGCQYITPVTYQITGTAAQFSGSPLSGCAPLTSCLSNTSTGASGYFWIVTDAAGNLVTTNYNPRVCLYLTKPGVYSVKLIVTDSTGCSDTLYKPDYIRVGGPVSDFRANPLTGCTPQTVNFTDMSATPASVASAWKWNFGDNASGAADSSSLQNPVHIYARTGTYTVSLLVKDTMGCISDTAKYNYISVSHVVASFSSSVTTGCQGTQVCFTNDSSGGGFTALWNFGDSSTSNTTNPCHNYTTGGTYTVALFESDSTGCTESATKVYTVNVTRPHANFIADTTISTCPPLQVNFSNLSTSLDPNSTFLWLFGDGQVSSVASPVHIYNIAGIFSVTLVASNPNGCKDTMTIPDYIRITGPTGYLSSAPTSGCAPHYTCFGVVSSSTLNYIWNFGDGTVQSGPDSICYTYVRTGTFYPELILNNGAGCIFSLPLGIVNITGAVAAFGLDNPSFCKSGTVNFTDSSFGGSPVQQWRWNFDDPASGALNTSALQNPPYFFADSGTYHISLFISTADGCMDSTVRAVIAKPSPVVSFSITNPVTCSGNTVFFTDETASPRPVQNRLWNFGDPLSGPANTSSLFNPSHVYAAAGNYAVTLTETQTNGCSDSASSALTVHQGTVALFTASDTCLNTQPIVFINGSQHALNYDWNFGDGSASTLSAPSHSYPGPGTFTVRLIARNATCADTFSAPVRIFAVPTAAFNLNSNDLCGPPAAINAVNTSTGAALSSLWNFGDPLSGAANFSAVASARHIYSATGNYVITLIEIAANGCKDSASLNVTVNQKALASFTASDTCLNTQPIIFNNVSQHALNYEWNFGDGSVSSQILPSHSYAGPGTFTVMLIARNSACADTLSAPVKIFPVPTASFNLSSGDLCGPPAIINGVNTSSGGALSSMWKFGDPLSGSSNFSALSNPGHVYNAAGNYSITLVETGANGCSDSASANVTVNQKARAFFTAFDTCFNTQPIFFKNNSEQSAHYEWHFGDGNSSVQTNPSHTYGGSGTYQVTLIAGNTLCPDTFTTPVLIFPVPHASFILPFAYSCGPAGAIHVQNTSTGAAGYFWDFGNHITSTYNNPVISYAAPGLYIITLAAQNIYLCADTTAQPFTVYPNPVIRSIDVQPVAGCQPLTVNVHANATNANSFTWNFGDNSSPYLSNLTSATYTYPDSGNFTISLQVVSFKDCSDTMILTDTIHVHAAPRAGFNDSVNTAIDPVNGTVVFTNKSENANSYLWNFGDGFTSTEVNPTHLFNNINSYTVLLVAANNSGCSDSVSKTFYVLKKTLYVPNAFAPDFDEGSGLVKVWLPAGTGLKQYHARIFDKWGELLWESKALTESLEPAEGWDGTYQGKICQQDVYVWKIEAVFVDGSRWEGMQYQGGPKKTIGSVTLIR